MFRGGRGPLTRTVNTVIVGNQKIIYKSCQITEHLPVDVTDSPGLATVIVADFLW